MKIRGRLNGTKKREKMEEECEKIQYFFFSKVFHYNYHIKKIKRVDKGRSEGREKEKDGGSLNRICKFHLIRLRLSTFLLFLFFSFFFFFQKNGE